MDATTPGSSGEELLAARTSLAHVLKRLTEATLGFAAAYVVAAFVTNRFRGEDLFAMKRLMLDIPVHLLFGAVALTLTSALPILRDLLDVKRLVSANERTLKEQALSQVFLRNVHDAFEMADDEAELFEITGVALDEVAHSDVGGAEILVADSSGAHVARVVVANVGSEPGCGVLTPGSCPAVRRGQTLQFADPNGLAACPRLRERQLADGMGATCVPITVLGTPSAVLHTTYAFIDDPVEYQKKVTSLEGLAGNFGARLGMMRAMSQTQLQADTDPLTGLLNRRSMENRVRVIRGEGREFALAMLDLDHFKRLNDTFGHDTGDRSLRLFSRVLTETFRDTDIICRHGGEEFVVVLPGADVTTAAPVLHRLRERLAQAIGRSEVPPFTVSIGLCDSTWSDDLQDLLNAADRALMIAKDEGRDRLIIDDPNLRPDPLAETITTD